jgi:hypothetical protein
MDGHSKRTPLTPVLSLIPLESALMAAEKLTPSRAPRPNRDPNELLATQLIERIKRPQPAAFPALQIEPPQPPAPILIHEMAGRDA